MHLKTLTDLLEDQRRQKVSWVSSTVSAALYSHMTASPRSIYGVIEVLCDITSWNTVKSCWENMSHQF